MIFLPIYIYIYISKRIKKQTNKQTNKQTCALTFRLKTDAVLRPNTAEMGGGGGRREEGGGRREKASVQNVASVLASDWVLWPLASLE